MGWGPSSQETREAEARRDSASSIQVPAPQSALPGEFQCSLCHLPRVRETIPDRSPVLVASVGGFSSLSQSLGRRRVFLSLDVFAVTEGSGAGVCRVSDHVQGIRKACQGSKGSFPSWRHCISLNSYCNIKKKLLFSQFFTDEEISSEREIYLPTVTQQLSRGVRFQTSLPSTEAIPYTSLPAFGGKACEESEFGGGAHLLGARKEVWDGGVKRLESNLLHDSE